MLTSRSILVALACVTGTTARSNTICQSTGQKFIQETKENAGDFNPEALLRAHGIDPGQLAFRLLKDAAGMVMLTARYQGDLAGFISITPALSDTGTYPVVAKVEIAETFRGKGLGAVLYTAVAREIYKSGDGILTRSEIVSKDAISFWNRLLKLGYAETIGSEYGDFVRMKRDVVAGQAGKTAWEFVERRLLKDG